MLFVLIANYVPDKQQSMNLFAGMLADGFKKAGHTCEIWTPPVLFGAKAKSTNAGLGKWLAYVDKWLLFPLVLKMRLLKSKYRNGDVRFHICDHSNAPYLPHLPKNRTAITCHDVLAIRGAMGFADAYCESSSAGKILQKWILKNLSGAKLIACVSELTLNQLQALSQNSKPYGKKWVVIHNAFNGLFFPVKPNVAIPKITAAGFPGNRSYLLHVGSALPRKNRKLLIDMMFKLGERWDGIICYAGMPADKELTAYAKSLQLEERIFSIKRPDHETLLALYSTCDAFVFPSYSEGFGWPVIEAQACKAPVIASNIEPLPEVSGGAALHADPNDPEAFANAFLLLKQPAFKENLLQKGLLNSKRFDPDSIIRSYLELHGV
jgi:glycosyltransferase involved in cell wall biosynthesis